MRRCIVARCACFILNFVILCFYVLFLCDICVLRVYVISFVVFLFISSRYIILIATITSDFLLLFLFISLPYYILLIAIYCCDFKPTLFRSLML